MRMAGHAVRSARFADLDTTTLYALLRLRSEVFVAEQQSAYNDLDGKDLDASTVHFWVPDASGAPLAYLRLIEAPDGLLWITRVVTARHARRQGLAALLIEAALEEIGERPSRLNAQTHAMKLYQRYGYEVDGPEFLEDGIPHVPMRRPSLTPSSTAASGSASVE